MKLNPVLLGLLSLDTRIIVCYMSDKGAHGEPVTVGILCSIV